MQDDANDPEAVPARAETGPAARWRAATLLGIGVGVGLALGVLLTVGVSATHTFLTPTLPLPVTRDSMQVLNELNELRRQVNQLNEDKKVQDQGKDDAMRRALSALASAVRERASAAPGVAPSAEKQGGGMAGTPARRASDPFAELDAEIKSLEQTQTVLNAILDLFLPAGKEPAKERPPVTDPPK
jgi:hypothetical protein